MSPRHDEFAHFFRDLPFLQEHLEDIVLEELFQGLRVQRPGRLE
jgi:hypothetical protein